MGSERVREVAGGHGPLAPVSPRTGLGGVETAVLDVVAEICGSGSGSGPFRTTARVVEHLERRFGFGSGTATP